MVSSLAGREILPYSVHRLWPRSRRRWSPSRCDSLSLLVQTSYRLQSPISSPSLHLPRSLSKSIDGFQQRLRPPSIPSASSLDFVLQSTAVMNSPTYPTFKIQRLPLDPADLNRRLDGHPRQPLAPVITHPKAFTPESSLTPPPKMTSPETPPCPSTLNPCAGLEMRVKMLEKEIQYYEQFLRPASSRIEYWQQKFSLTEQMYILTRSEATSRSQPLQDDFICTSNERRPGDDPDNHGRKVEKSQRVRKRPAKDCESGHVASSHQIPRYQLRSKDKKRRST